MGTIDELLAANTRYADASDRERLGREPKRRLAVVSCMDSRIDLFAVLGLRNGEAHVIRNAGGIVTDDVRRSLLLSQRALGTRRVVLIHHTDCGLSKVDEDELADQVERETGVRPPFRFGAFRDVDESVRESMRRVRSCEYLDLTEEVRGFVYDVDTGRLREVAEEG